MIETVVITTLVFILAMLGMGLGVLAKGQELESGCAASRKQLGSGPVCGTCGLTAGPDCSTGAFDPGNAAERMV